MGHSEDVSQGFYFLPHLYTITVLQDFQNLQDHTFYHLWIIFRTIPVTSP